MMCYTWPEPSTDQLFAANQVKGHLSCAPPAQLFICSTRFGEQSAGFSWYSSSFGRPALIVEVVAYFVAGHPAHYQPSILADIIAAVIGLSLGYAGALTVLVKEVIGFTVATIQTIEQDVKSEVSGGSNLLDTIVQRVQSGGR